MSDLFNSFKQALAQAGPGLVAQMQGKDEVAQAFYKAGMSQAAQQRQEKQRQFDSKLKMNEAQLKIQQAKDSAILRQQRRDYENNMFRLKQQQALEGKPDTTKLQQMKDTYNADTNNPVAFDPSKRDNAIVDMVTGKPAAKVYTGVQNRFDAKRSDSLDKELRKEWERQTPVKAVLNALDVTEQILEKGDALVQESDSIFEFTKMGFTGKARAMLHDVQSQSSFFEFDEIDRLYDNFRGNTTQVIANQVRSFTGAQATDAEREFLMQTAPDPRLSPAANRTRIFNLRRMLKFLDDRNAAIEARIGKPVDNVANHMAPGQDLFTFARQNNLMLGKEANQTDSLTIDQQQKVNKIKENTERQNQLLKELESLDQ